MTGFGGKHDPVDIKKDIYEDCVLTMLRTMFKTSKDGGWITIKVSSLDTNFEATQTFEVELPDWEKLKNSRDEFR